MNENKAQLSMWPSTLPLSLSHCCRDDAVVDTPMLRADYIITVAQQQQQHSRPTKQTHTNSLKRQKSAAHHFF